MNKPPDRLRKNLLRLKLTLAAVLSLSILGWLSWDAYSNYRDVKAQLPTIGRMEMVVAEIVRFSELLTSSARMAAVSGDLDWETRYRRSELQLDQSIKEALRLDPQAFQGTAAARIGAADAAQDAMEARAFELVRQGKKAEAQRLLSSAEYETQQKIYAEGLAEFNRHLLQARDSLHKALLVDMRWSAMTTIVSAVLLILGSLFVFRATRRAQATIVESNLQLIGKTAELGELNNLLDRKVGERTKALNESALASLNMMEDAIRQRENTEQAYVVLEKTHVQIAHLNRVYALLSGINTLIVRVRDRDELFRQACRIAVEQGGFRMSLIAILDRSAMKVVPVASAGKDEELMTAIKSLLSSSEDAPNTMVAQAIRDKKPVVSNDSQHDPRILFPKKYVDSGVRSIAVLPLIVSDEAVGVLALYASEVEFFHEEELKLLTALAGDVAFAIDHIDKQDRLDYLAYYDVLTGLANRSLFLERVAQYMRSAVSGGHKLGLFLVDLERFKNINDSLGQAAGDALLKQVAEWLTRNAGDVSLLARVGADHFALVMPEVRQDGDMTRFLERKMETLAEHPFRLNDAVFRIAVKVGVAFFPDDGANADTLFRNAEAALKKAKAGGDRYLFYTQKMTETVAVKLTLENQLRQALDNEEFVLHYQPKVSLVTGKLTGAEALIRWNDPRTGLVPPGRFIPILEETGLIHEVGRWALRKAVEDYQRWRSKGLAAVRVAVNLSPLQLRNRGFIAEIKQALGIDAQAAAGLELEITESLIMADVRLSIASLEAIRDMGVTIAIDDFGTGFSSLSYLSRLPVDTLKIDRSFVIDITAGPEGLALVSTIINMAHSLRLKVVAEGVETEEQARLLRLLDCDEMQGYLVSKPVPGEIFETKFLDPAPADVTNNDEEPDRGRLARRPRRPFPTGRKNGIRQKP
jgi:diguanylate cyclase (GGDEF)-like protein